MLIAGVTTSRGFFWLRSATEEPPGVLGQAKENHCPGMTHLPTAEKTGKHFGEEHFAG